MGKLESTPPRYSAHLPSSSHLPWHAHITALTIAPPARRLGLAHLLTSSLESAGDNNNAYFVDLFVRVGNGVAISMYRSWGYSVWRRVVGYYSGPDGGGGEDAFGELIICRELARMAWALLIGEQI